MFSTDQGRIFLEMELVFNPLRAAWRLLFPREERHGVEKQQKLNLKLLRRNYMRVWQLYEV